MTYRRIYDAQDARSHTAKIGRLGRVLEALEDGAIFMPVTLEPLSQPGRAEPLADMLSNPSEALAHAGP